MPNDFSFCVSTLVPLCYFGIWFVVNGLLNFIGVAPD